MPGAVVSSEDAIKQERRLERGIPLSRRHQYLRLYIILIRGSSTINHLILVLGLAILVSGLKIIKDMHVMYPRFSALLKSFCL